MVSQTEIRFEDHVQHVTNELGEIITSFKPDNPDGWEAFEVLVQAHKTLRKLPLEKLVQLPFPFHQGGKDCL